MQRLIAVLAVSLLAALIFNGLLNPAPAAVPGSTTAPAAPPAPQQESLWTMKPKPGEPMEDFAARACESPEYKRFVAHEDARNVYVVTEEWDSASSDEDRVGIVVAIAACHPNAELKIRDTVTGSEIAGMGPICESFPDTRPIVVAKAAVSVRSGTDRSGERVEKIARGHILLPKRRCGDRLEIETDKRAGSEVRSFSGWVQLSEVCAPRWYTRSVRPSHLPAIIVIAPECAFDTEYP